MKPKPLFLAALAIAGAGLLVGPDTRGQAGAAAPATAAVPGTPEAEMAALLAEVVAQQAHLDENQTQIELKLANIAEDMRLARINAARSGGKGGSR